MSLSPVARVALKVGLAALSPTEQDCHGDVIARVLDVLDSACLLTSPEVAAELEQLRALTPARIQTCRVCGAGYTFGEPCSVCLFHARMAREVAAKAASWEDPHDSVLHHRYRTPRDLPPLDGAR